MTILSWRVGISATSRAALSFIVVSAVLDVVAMGIVIPILPVLIEQFAGSKSAAGVFSGLFVALWALMQFVAAPVLGALADRFGRRPVLLISTAGLAADYMLMALAPSLWWLAVGRIVAGITSANLTTVNAYISDITPPDRRAQAFGILGAAFSAGVVAGPLLGGTLGEISPRMPFWTAGALSAVALCYGILVLPESLPRDRRISFSWQRANPIGALTLLGSQAGLRRLSAVSFMLYFAYHVFSAIFVLYASLRFEWSMWKVGALFALIGTLDVLVQSTLIVPLIKRLGERRTMLTGLVAGAVGMACIGLAPNGFICVLATVPTALRCLALPTLQSQMTRCVSELQQGRLQGANLSVTSAAGVIAPIFFGAVYSVSLTYTSAMPAISGTAFIVAAVVLILAAMLCMQRHRREKAMQAHISADDSRHCVPDP